MLSPQITECQDCQSLKNLLQLVGCSLQNFLRNKLNNEKYNVESFYCQNTVTALSHYQRIITKKIYNPSYLCSIERQDIVNQVRKLIFGDCSNCITCESSTTSSSSSSSSTTFTTTNID